MLILALKNTPEKLISSFVSPFSLVRLRKKSDELLMHIVTNLSAFGSFRINIHFFSLKTWLVFNSLKEKPFSLASEVLTNACSTQSCCSDQLSSPSSWSDSSKCSDKAQYRHNVPHLAPHHYFLNQVAALWTTCEDENAGGVDLDRPWSHSPPCLDHFLRCAARTPTSLQKHFVVDL